MHLNSIPSSTLGRDDELSIAQMLVLEPKERVNSITIIHCNSGRGFAEEAIEDSFIIAACTVIFNWCFIEQD